MKKRKNYKEEIRVLLVLVIVAFTVKTSVAEIYVVPTGSMENTILVGDMLFGNKFIYGMKTPTWIGVPYTRMGFDIPWFRLPKFKKVESGDIVIFEFPRDPFQKYVKRCIGIAGDYVELDSGKIYVNDVKMEFPKEGKYSKGFVRDKDYVNHALYPKFRSQNEDNIERFQVPYKGMPIVFSEVESWESIISLLVLDKANIAVDGYGFSYVDPFEIAKTRGFLKYKFLSSVQDPRKVMQKQQRDMKDYMLDVYGQYAKEKTLNPWIGPLEDFNFILNQLYSMDSSEMLKRVSIDGVTLEELGSYTLQHDYYFLIGDNRDNSYDSRYWGFVPDYHVLGSPIFSIINLASVTPKLGMVR